MEHEAVQGQSCDIDQLPINQLLTDRGCKQDFSPYIMGRVVEEQQGEFFGRKDLVKKITREIKTTGIVVLQGGYRSGKSSLLKAAGGRLLREGKIQTVIDYELNSSCEESPEQVIEEIKEDGCPALIILEELEAYKEDLEELLRRIDCLKKEGYKIALAVIGDLHGNSPKELPSIVKKTLLDMAGDSIVANRPFNDREMFELLSHGERPLFAEPLMRYLIAEAGGSPYLGNALANACFKLLKFQKIGSGAFTQMIEREIRDSGILDNFASNIDIIIAAGFNPLTWEWKGKGKKPEVNIYQNMIPSSTSTIFRNWLADYIEKKQRQIILNEA